jgi:glycosyltransferase involved in cell wall biosynthesis
MHPGAVYIVGGTGPEEPHLRSLAQELGIADRVRFPGHIPERDLPDYLAATDLFLSLDVADFDIAPYEALALGAAVVWSTEMDLEQPLVGHPRLFPVEPEPGPVAAAMTKVLEQPGPRIRLPDRLRRYTWENYFGRKLDELRQVVAELRAS